MQSLEQELKKLTANLAPSKQAEVEAFFRIYRERLIAEVEKMKVCPECKGTTYADGKSCSICEGSGQIDGSILDQVIKLLKT